MQTRPTHSPRHSRCPAPTRTQPAHASQQALPSSSSTPWAHILQGYWPTCPEQAGIGQEQCPGQGEVCVLPTAVGPKICLHHKSESRRSWVFTCNGG